VKRTAEATSGGDGANHGKIGSSRIGVIGATGVVGREMLAILGERGVDAGALRCIASSRSVGLKLPYGETHLSVGMLDDDAFEDLDVALFAAGVDTARRWAKRAVSAGCRVIDNSSAFRDDPAVPLVIPEINGHLLEGSKGPGIIASPNCSTTIAMMAVAPIHRLAGIRSMSVTTYQSVSGAGAEAMEELEQQVRQHAAGETITNQVLPSTALLNVFNHESPIDADGFNEEERKIRFESRRILDAPEITISATCVRVGVLRAHAMAIELVLEKGVEVDEIREMLAGTHGIRVVDDRTRNRFPEPRHAAGRDEIEIGRLRIHPDRPDGTGLLLFAAGDQLRKGAALNTIQILERLQNA
jgi:aspartate-semialdehyde dehydrogenase